MSEIKINQEDYEFFNDYKDIMVQAFGIACSICGSSNITYVKKGHPETIGNLVKKLGDKLSDEQLDKALEEPINSWQIFDDLNCDKNEATYLCDECYNTFQK